MISGEKEDVLLDNELSDSYIEDDEETLDLMQDDEEFDEESDELFDDIDDDENITTH